MKHIMRETNINEAACGAALVEVKLDTSKGLVVKHERELLVDAAWKSDCEACRAPVLKHMGVPVPSNRTKMQSACGQRNKQPYVRVARESDCNNCRAALLIAPVQEKNMGLHNPKWEPQPMENADEICASARANREGAQEDDGLTDEDVEVLNGPPTGVI